MTRRGARCSVDGCFNFKIIDGQKYSFYRFPKKTERCVAWIKSIGRAELEETLKCKGAEYLNKKFVVCSEHFKPSDFRNKRLLSQGLWPNVVPSVFHNCGPALNTERTDNSADENVHRMLQPLQVVDLKVEKEYLSNHKGCSSFDTENKNMINPESKADLVVDGSGGRNKGEFLKQMMINKNRLKKFTAILPKSDSNKTESKKVVSDSNSAREFCPSTFVIVNGEEDVKLSVPPVVQLLKTDYSNSAQLPQRNALSSPHSTSVFGEKCDLKSLLLDHNSLSSSSLSSTLTKLSEADEVVNDKKTKFCKVKNVVIPLQPQDVDLTEIRVLDRILKTPAKGKNVSMSEPPKRGVDYELSDDNGNVTKVTAEILCRICGRYGEEHLIPIYSDVCNKNLVPDVINKYLPIKVSKNDTQLPNNICHLCVSYLIDWQRLVKKCSVVDKWLHEIFNVEPDSTQQEKENIDGKFIRKLHWPRQKTNPVITVTAEKNGSKNIVQQKFFDNSTLVFKRTDFDHDYCISGRACANDKEDEENSKLGKNLEADIMNSSTNFTCVVRSSSKSLFDDAVVSGSDFADSSCNIADTVNNSCKKRKGQPSTDCDSEKRKKYKIFSLSVRDKKNNNDLKHNTGFSESDMSDCRLEKSEEFCPSTSKGISIKDSGFVESVQSEVIIRNIDDNSRDTLSPPPQPLSLDVLENVNSSDIGSALTLVNNKENTTVLNKEDTVVSSNQLSTDRYIAKQRYKVSITLMKAHKRLLCGINETTSSNICKNWKCLDRLCISVSKEKKTDCKLSMKSLWNANQSYSRLAIFDCKHCIFYQMTANEFGKHMKLFHPDKPLCCPVCGHVFKEDYNLIIHLQVTSCGKVSAHENKENSEAITTNAVSGCVHENPDTQCVSNPERCKNLDSSENSELRVTVKISDIISRDNDNEGIGNEEVNQSLTDEHLLSSEVQEIYGLFNDLFLEKECYEFSIETWKPSTTCVSFEPGIVFLDGLEFLNFKLCDIIKKEIEKLLKLQVLSLFDCAALKTMLDTKVSHVLKTAWDNRKSITIKSIDSAVTDFNNANSIEKPLGKKILHKPIKTLFRQINRGRPSLLKDICSAGPLIKVIKRNRPQMAKKESYCDKCNLKFHSRQSISRHRRLNHVERKCKYCDEVFSVLAKLNKHEKVHKKSDMLRCEICNIKFVTKERMKKHNLLNHDIGEYVACELCGKKFSAKSGLYTHKKNVHNNEQYLCPHCGQIYKSLSGLKCHIQGTHVVQNDAVCPMCNKTYQNRRKLNVHMASHRKKNEKVYSCNICSKTFYTATGIKQHQERHSTGLVAFCSICGMGSKRPSRVTSHIKEMHWTSVNKPADVQFPCLICSIMLDDGDSLAQHMMFHSDDDSLVQKVTGSKEGKIKCQDCEFYVGDKKELALHKFYFHKDLPFKCYIDNCNVKFWSKAALDAHSKQNHGRFTFECKKCDETFNSVKKKNCHLQNVHQINVSRTKISQEIHMCDTCGNTFSSAFSLSRHRINVHQHDRQSYSCDQCGNIYYFKAMLDEHILWHAKSLSKDNDIDYQDTIDDIVDRANGTIIDGEVEIDFRNDLNYGGSPISVETGDSKNGEIVLSMSADRTEEVNSVKETVEVGQKASSVIVQKILTSCAVQRCTFCNIIFKDKSEMCSHFSDKHNDVQHLW